VQEDHEESGEAGERRAGFVRGGSGRAIARACHRGDAGGESDAFDERVQREADGSAGPGQFVLVMCLGVVMNGRGVRVGVGVGVAGMIMRVAACMIVIVFTFMTAGCLGGSRGSRGNRRGRGGVVVMEAEEPLDEEHDQEAREEPEDDGVGDAVDRGMVQEHAPAATKCGVFNAGHEGVGNHVEEADAEHDACDKADRKLHAFVRELDDQRDPPSRERGREDENAIEDERESWRHGSRRRAHSMRAGRVRGNRRKETALAGVFLDWKAGDLADIILPADDNPAGQSLGQ
jgi:hypothetical protein